MRASEFTANRELEEGWRDTLAHLGMIGALAGVGTGAMTVRQAIDSPAVPVATKAEIAVKADIPPAQLPPSVAQQVATAKQVAAAPLERVPLQIQAVTGDPKELMLKNYAKAEGITGIELAAFLAQCAHETQNFSKMIETASGQNYEPMFVKDKKTGRIIVDPQTNRPKNFNPTAAKLGNTQIGDGAKFKGRGFIQLTGRYNYGQASRAIFGDNTLIEKPWLAEDPKIAARIAVWYWKSRVANRVDDYSDVRAVTQPINAGLNGLRQRMQAFDAYMRSGQS